MQGILIHFGYLDPGTGSMIIQAIIGVIAGVAVFGRRVIASTALKIKSLFTKKHRDAKQDPQENSIEKDPEA